MKKIIGILSAGFLWVALIAPASAGPIGAGITLTVGQYETDGTETEKTVTGVTSETNSKTVESTFAGASVYAELRTEGGWAIGVDYVPTDIDLGDGTRQDNEGIDPAENDSGARSASAEASDLTTIYAHIPVGPAYVLLGYHDVDIKTTETLPTSTYGDVSINGYQYGIGVKSENSRVRAEVAYSDFDSISLSSSADSTQKITADMDALSLRLSLGF